MKVLSWRTFFGGRSDLAPPVATARELPSPPLRLVAGNRIALRAFDWNADADCVAIWQRETYALNFPDFTYTADFEAAFRHDLRRAGLDENNGLFVLDNLPGASVPGASVPGASVPGASVPETAPGGLCGFLWVVLCHNNWTGEHYGYVNNLYILPARRGQALSDELLNYAESWFRERGVSKMRLTVTTSNLAACRLYGRMGYQTQRLEMEKDI